jgi:hypothetical protein
MDNVFLTSIFLFSFILCLIYISQPKYLFDEKTNKIKEFGLNINNKTIITYPLFCALFAVMIYLLCTIYSIFDL